MNGFQQSYFYLNGGFMILIVREDDLQLKGSVWVTLIPVYFEGGKYPVFLPDGLIPVLFTLALCGDFQRF